MNMDVSVEGLLKRSLAKLRNENSLAKECIRETSELRRTINEKPIIGRDEIMVLLGAEYWVTKSKSEALDFLDRRIKRFENVTEHNSLKLKQGKETLEHLQNFIKATEDQTEEKADTQDLPIIDIQEEIDEEGNVVNVKLNDKKMGDHEHSFSDHAYDCLTQGPNYTSRLEEIEAFTNDHDTTKVDSSLKVTDEMERATDSKKRRNIQAQNDPNESNSQLLELMEDLALSENVQKEDSISRVLSLIASSDISDEHKEALEQEFTNGARQTSFAEKISDNNLDSEKRQIYELELLASEFDEDDVSIEEEEFEYDFENGDSDDFLVNLSEDDDAGDDLLYNRNCSLLPKNSNILDRLWKDILSLRESKKLPENPTTNKTTKSVRFSDKLQIKQIENVSEKLNNIEHKKHAMLRFKEARVLTGSSLPGPPHKEAAFSSMKNKKIDGNFTPIKASDLSHDSSQKDGFVALDSSRRENTVTRNILERGNPVTQNIVERDSPIIQNIVERNSRVIQSGVERENPIAQNIVERESPITRNIIEHTMPVKGNDPREKLPISTEIDTQIFKTKSQDSIEFKKLEGERIVNTAKETTRIGPNADGDFENLRNDLISSQLKQKTSKYRQMKMQNPSRNPKVSQTGAKIIQTPQLPSKLGSVTEKSGNPSFLLPKRPLAGVEMKFDDAKSDTLKNTESTTTDEKAEVRELSIDTSQLQDDMESMVQAYNVGMFDDDMEVLGPIVDQMDDFEKLNRIVESMAEANNNGVETGNGEKSQALNSDYDESLNEIGFESEDNDNILKEFIVENEGFFESEESELFDEDSVQQSVLEEEVVSNYYRLKEKIMQAAPVTSNMELEYFDEAPRESLFKTRTSKFVNR